MTIRRQWLIVLAVVAIVSVMVHAFFINVLTDKSFKSYLQDNYNTHVQQIQTYATQAMSSDTLSLDQMAMELQTHLDEPITRIQLFSPAGELLVDVTNDQMPGMRGGGGRHGRMGEPNGTSQIKSITLTKNGKTLGKIHVTHYASMTDSLGATQFQSEMMQNTIWSVALVLVIALLIGWWISHRVSRDLMRTATFAERLDEGEDRSIAASRVSEVRRIQQSLLSLRQKLRLKQKVRKTVLDELVHQTRTPLTIMKTRLEALEDGVIPFSRHEAEVMHHQVDALTELLANVTRLIDVSGEAYPVKLTAVDLRELLTRIAAGMKPQFERKGIVLDVDPGQAGIAQTDSHLLSQVLYNVVTNAFKYTEVGGQVNVTCAQTDGVYEIRVQDTGRGIAADDLSAIFDAYYRGSQTNEIEGDGLGLYVAKQNMDRLGGSIAVESTVGEGTTFTVRIPII
jgi:signal transduction histidine kinase